MKRYSEKTKAIQFRIPISEISKVRHLVYDYLNGVTIHIKEESEDVCHKSSHITTYTCGCSMHHDLFHRKKGCVLKKEEHKI